MSDRNLLFLDIQPKSGSSTSTEGKAEEPLWTRSNNSFRFNFFSESSPPQVEKPSTNRNKSSATNQISFTGQDSSFAFDFQIPPASAVDDMETTQSTDASNSSKQEQANLIQEANEPPESDAHLKTKKKKKSGKKEPSQHIPAAKSEGHEEPSAEKQLSRQLDWCIEQLERGLMSQKGTPKQKEEASRALKTLRSSKAPLVKKRQVMRAMAGDYRQKMTEEKSKQFKLIQTELSSAQVKPVSESPKKSVFHRKAEVKAQTKAAEESVGKACAKDSELMPQTEEEKPHFVFVPSKEEFHFNFLE
ncbi:UPF0488 protein C8orf33 homolog [Gouania willdenowi]|uniref:UPF0488 protein C8orf33 homolog n=2 Tax=Gouania willdenowi TaxID=441366 RepID=A0A8C5EGD7_GOUWI|nr:UPF0488 protein C8orf33 homolog [Gouania willdenowi]